MSRVGNFLRRIRNKNPRQSVASVQKQQNSSSAYSKIVKAAQSSGTSSVYNSYNAPAAGSTSFSGGGSSSSSGRGSSSGSSSSSSSSSSSNTVPDAQYPGVSVDLGAGYQGISAAEAQIAAAKEQLRIQRENAYNNRAEALRQRGLLESSRKKLPEVKSAKSLRQTYTGLRGRDYRRKVKGADANITKGIGEINTYNQKLTEYETSLDTYETKELKPVEESIMSAKKYNSALASVKKAQSKGKVAELAMFGSGEVKKLAQKVLDLRKADKTQWLKEQAKIKTILPAETMTKTLIAPTYIQKNTPTVITNTPSVLNAGRVVGSTVATLIPSPNKTISVDTGIIPPTYEKYSGRTTAGKLIQQTIKLPEKALDFVRGQADRISTIYGVEQQTGLGNVGSVNNKPLVTWTGAGITTGVLNVNTGKIEKVTEAKANLIDASRNLKQIQYVDIVKFENANKFNGNFDVNKLSPEKYTQYQNLYGGYTNAYDDYTQRQKAYDDALARTSTTFTSNILGYKTEKVVPATSLSSPFGYVAESIKVNIKGISNLGSEAYGATTTIVNKKVSKVPFINFGSMVKGDITGKEFIKSFKKEKPGIVLDLNTGVARLPTKTDLTLPDSLFLQKKEVAAGLNIGLTAGAYFTPVLGETLWGAEVGESLSQVGYSPKRFLKEKPAEAYMLLGIGAIGAASKISRGVKRYNLLAAEKELKQLNSQPIRYIEEIKKPSGEIIFYGEQTSKNLNRKIELKGKLSKGATGVEYLPATELISTTSGSYRGFFGNKKKIFQVDKFSASSGGTSRQIETLGELTLYNNLGVGTIVPKVPKKGGEAIIDVSQSFTLTKGNEFGLNLGRNSLGITFVTNTKKIENVGKRITGGTKTSLESTFATQELKVVPKPIVDVEKVYSNIGKVEIVKPKVKSSSPISIYSGTGLYERTESFSTQKFLPGKTQLGVGVKIEKQTQFIDTTYKPILKEKTKQASIILSGFKTAQGIKQVTKQKVKQVTKQKYKTAQVFKEIYKSQNTQQVSKQLARIKTPTNIIPKIIITKRSSDKKSPTILTGTKGTYKSFARIAGEDVLIGTSETKKGAKKKLLGTLSKELRASGFVSVGGKKVKLGELGKNFRRSKVDSFRVVEKKDRRIKIASKSKESKTILSIREQRRRGNNVFTK